MAADDRLTYDVRIWEIAPYKGTRRTTYRVRWQVAKKERRRTFQTRKLAQSFRASLMMAATSGNAFDTGSGLPEAVARTASSVTWYVHAMEFVATKWPSASAKSRRSIAEALATVTPALTKDGRGRPTPAQIRALLYHWSFNMAARSKEIPSEHTKAHEWMVRNSFALRDLTDAALTRRALDTLALKLDGTQAAQTTIARKRAVFYGALRYAVELDRIATHPMEKVQWKTPKANDEVDGRVVVNPTQVTTLLRAVRGIDPAMEAFFACLYYAAMRPAEVLHLRESDCTLPADGWGELLLTGSTQYVGAWGDGVNVREDQSLKHRAQTATRRVPACPTLVKLLRRHVEEFGVGLDGRLFVTRTGSARMPVAGPFARPVSSASYGKTWRRARSAALTESQAASPLARRPYDLRHAGVSLWLNAGVPATTVAEWAGHSVAVLLRVYAKCVDGEGEAARRRVEWALNEGGAGGSKTALGVRANGSRQSD